MVHGKRLTSNSKRARPRRTAVGGDGVGHRTGPAAARTRHHAKPACIGAGRPRATGAGGDRDRSAATTCVGTCTTRIDCISAAVDGRSRKDFIDNRLARGNSIETRGKR